MLLGLKSDNESPRMYDNLNMYASINIASICIKQMDKTKSKTKSHWKREIFSTSLSVTDKTHRANKDI